MSHITIQRAPAINRNLTPLNLLMAGVAPKDVVWFRGLPGNDKLAELKKSARGIAILQQVHEREMQKLQQAMGLRPAGLMAV